MVGVGLNQPTIVRRRDGTLLAYLRREGPPPHRVQLSTSSDNGETWSLAEETRLPNPDSSLEVIALRDGRIVADTSDLAQALQVLHAEESEEPSSDTVPAV